MKIKTFVIGYVFALAIFLFAQHRSAPEEDSRYVVVDLTHTVNAMQREQAAAVDSSRDDYFARQMAPAEQYGTRLNAPARDQHGLWTVDQIPVERLVAPLVVLNVQSKAARNPDYQISVDDIANWEQIHGHVPQGAVVMANTGWDSRWSSASEYRNADARQVMHFPGYSSDAARFLVEGRTVIGLGIDTLSTDAGASKDSPVRKYASSHSLYQLENVANLAQAPEFGATVVIAPGKVQGSAGTPVRILALVK